MVLLATAATVIGSQAVITGAYSVASQAASARLPPAAADCAHLGVDDRPDLGAVDQLDPHDLRSDAGVRLPARPRSPTCSAWRSSRRSPSPRCSSSTSLGSTGGPRSSWWFSAAAACWSSTCCSWPRTTKLAHRAWLPLLIDLTAFTVMTTWQRGREVVTRERSARRARCARSSTRCTSDSPRCGMFRAPRSSSTAASRPLRWRCGPTSSTTRCGTSAW